MHAECKPNIVIIGGSFAGLCACRHLASSLPHAQICVVDPKDYFEYTPGVVHLLAGSNACNDLISPIEKSIPKGVKFIRGKFLGLDPLNGLARIQSTSSIIDLPFDALLLCNGLPYAPPIRPALTTTTPSLLTLANRIKEIDLYSNNLLFKHEHIVVLGGGLVGVELIADIAYRMNACNKHLKTKKQLHLISKSNFLLNTLPLKAGELAQQWLVKQGVHIVLDDEVVTSSCKQEGGDVIITTRKGHVISADIVIDCTGGRSTPIPGFITKTSENSNSSSTSSLFEWPCNTRGQVVVNEFLLSDKYQQYDNAYSPPVFAAGDVAEHSRNIPFAYSNENNNNNNKTFQTFPTIKNAHLAESQAELCAENVVRYFKWMDERKRLNLPGISLARQMKNEEFPPLRLLSYPKDIFGVAVNPLMSCVSLGPLCGIVVFNNIVLGGLLGGRIAAVLKFVIERTKVAEIRQNIFGRLFWMLGHVVSNFLHRLIVKWQQRFHKANNYEYKNSNNKFKDNLSFN